MNLGTYFGKHIHFIGIGGISMSGLAQIMLSRGCSVTGSDRTASAMTDKLSAIGIRTTIGHDLAGVRSADLVVYTAAIAPDDIELVEANALNKAVISRAELLGALMGEYAHAIGVAGTHGKTTTTGMISAIFLSARLNPTLHIGGCLDIIGSNVRVGGHDYFVTEACEYVESFLTMQLTAAVILNIDNDHLDYYKDIDHIYSAFKKFAGLLPDGGILVGCADNSLTARLMREAQARTIFSYGIENKADFMADNITAGPCGVMNYDLYAAGAFVRRMNLGVAGRHNVLNSLAAVALARAYDISFDDIARGLESFKGADRRFMYIGKLNNAVVIHDYAHHPTEISATLATAAALNHKKLYCVFQPHTYSRTFKLFEQMSNSFEQADKIILTDIYAAREKNTFNIHARDLMTALRRNGKDCLYISSFAEIADYLKSVAEDGDLILTMGAGSIEQLNPMLCPKCEH